MTNNNVVQFQEILAKAKECEVTQADIMSDAELAKIDLCWNNLAMEAEMQSKFIKHERAVAKFAKKAA